MAMTSGKSPLFQMEDSQKQKVGVDIQLIRDLAASLDVKLKIIDTFKGNEDIVDYVANNKADIGVAKMSYSVERSRRVFCSIPYQIVKMAMLVNRQELTRTSGDLSVLEFLNRAETKIGVVRQSAYSQFAKQLFPNAKIVEGDWDKDIIPQITRGELTAAFRDEIRVKSHLKLNPRASLDLYPLVFKHQTDPILIVSRPNSTQLYIWINSFLTYHAKSSQTVDELMSKYGDYIK